MCCFSLPPPGRPLKTRGSGLEEEFHLDPGKFDHVMVIQRVRLGVEGLAGYDRKACALYVGEEKALRPTRDEGHLDAGFDERRERLGEIERLVGVRTRGKVQLVLPRSSRNESCRMVTMTACSPLTARLSIWMSLCGLRPMVVRSLARAISLRTRLSILSISFAIAVSLCSNYLNQLIILPTMLRGAG